MGYYSFRGSAVSLKISLFILRKTFTSGVPQTLVFPIDPTKGDKSILRSNYFLHGFDDDFLTDDNVNQDASIGFASINAISGQCSKA